MHLGRHFLFYKVYILYILNQHQQISQSSHVCLCVVITLGTHEAYWCTLLLCMSADLCFFFQDLLQILFNRNYMHIKYHQNPTIISYIRHRQHQSKRGYSYEVQ